MRIAQPSTALWDDDVAAAVEIIEGLPDLDNRDQGVHRDRRANPASGVAGKHGPTETTEGLIGLSEAAQLLGYSIPGLRKIINRSRRKRAGEPVAGPTIRFHQAGPAAPIKFKREWIEEFVHESTCDPSQTARRRPEPRRKTKATRPEAVPSDAGRDLGFDPALYDV